MKTLEEKFEEINTAGLSGRVQKVTVDDDAGKRTVIERKTDKYGAWFTVATPEGEEGPRRSLVGAIHDAVQMHHKVVTDSGLVTVNAQWYREWFPMLDPDAGFRVIGITEGVMVWHAIVYNPRRDAFDLWISEPLDGENAYRYKSSLDSPEGVCILVGWLENLAAQAGTGEPA